MNKKKLGKNAYAFNFPNSKKIVFMVAFAYLFLFAALAALILAA